MVDWTGVKEAGGREFDNLRFRRWAVRRSSDGRRLSGGEESGEE